MKHTHSLLLSLVLLVLLMQGARSSAAVITVSDDGIFMNLLPGNSFSGGTILGGVIGNIDGGTFGVGTPIGQLYFDGTIAYHSGVMLFTFSGETPIDQYSQLFVTGETSIEGPLVFDFVKHFAPREGDVFTLIDANPLVDVNVPSFTINGLAPGWQFELEVQGNSLLLHSLSDAVWVPEVTSRWLLVLLSVGAVIWQCSLRRRIRD